jgi:sulfatase maturation enzyme AslB (radical SAM superfamily)
MEANHGQAPALICPFPFARMEFRNSQEFVPCCSNWLTKEYFGLPVGEDIWNGPAARALRQSVLDGTYQYCKRDHCKARLVNPAAEDLVTVSEAPISAVNREAILRGSAFMPEGPASFSVINDSRCNLACPSCRKEHIYTLDAATELELKRVDSLLEDYRGSLEVLKLAGDGEVFFSPWLRSIMERLNRDDFPKFRHVYVLSNGLLFNEANYRALLPGAEFIKYVSISVDAGNEETYRKVRGGSWAKLIENLTWIGEQKRKKLFHYFQMNFTVRQENFASIPEFIELAKKVGAGNAKFTSFFEYPNMGVPDFAAEAIHLPGHPRHGELHKIWEQISGDPFVRWSMPSPVKPDLP